MACLGMLFMDAQLPADASLPEGSWMVRLRWLAADASLLSASRAALLAHATQLRCLFLLNFLAATAPQQHDAVMLVLAHPSLRQLCLVGPLDGGTDELASVEGLLVQVSAALAAAQPALWERRRHQLSMQCIARHDPALTFLRML
ncbi:hypothetical protein ABPG75_004098 [Micractinium tetrahymenae]